MLRTYIIILFFALTINGIAQTNLSTNSLGGSSGESASLFSGLKAVDYGRNDFGSKGNIEGTTYLFKNWNNSSSIWQGDKIFNLDSLNYNLQTESFEFKLNKDSVFIIGPDKNINKVVINNHVFKTYQENDSNQNAFYEVIWENNDMSLLVEYNLIIKDGSIDPLTKNYITPKQYDSEEAYFIFNPNEEEKIHAIKLKKSDVLKLIDESYVNEIKAFAKKRKLKYKEISDIKEILTYYYSIKS